MLLLGIMDPDLVNQVAASLSSLKSTTMVVSSNSKYRECMPLRINYLTNKLLLHPLHHLNTTQPLFRLHLRHLKYPPPIRRDHQILSIISLSLLVSVEVEVLLLMLTVPSRLISLARTIFKLPTIYLRHTLNIPTSS